MSTEVIVATIAAAVALISAVISVYGQSRTTRLEHQLARQRHAESREEKANALIAKYRDPLVSSAGDFQSRLFSIVQLDFLRIYYDRSDQDREYATNNTLYVMAEFLGWVEILRREVQFLDLGDIEANRRLGELLASIRQAFLTDAVDLTFRLYRGQQRAIGELLIAKSQGKGLECIGYAEFSNRLNNPAFARWFSKLAADIESLAREENGNGERRLIMLQHSLVDLLDFLDPQKVRVPEEFRQRIMSTSREKKKRVRGLAGTPTTGLPEDIQTLQERGDLVQVVRATESIRRGDKITPKNVEPYMIVRAVLSPDMLKKLNQVVGKVARQRIPARTILCADMVE